MSEPEAAKKQSWAEGLLDEQARAASHVGSNARLLAGPGTGKTWTLRARVEFLVLERKIDADKITALTFTRAAAGELRQRVDRALEGKVATRPHITTLHSFALKTLLHNSDKLDALPRPLRIADDWEERNFVWEDLKALIDADVPAVRKHFQALSADWDTLRVDDKSPNPLQANPGFVGAWEEHRKVYGYTLRSELVYQLKRALEQRSDLEIKPAFSHLLVDEYQDLNKCDLAVVNSVTTRGAELYAAGDDDQSIYGFRYANPEGIRRFDQDYESSTDLTLATCLRCDKSIMHLAHFVAQLDSRRLDKPWQPRDQASEGEVHLLRFHNGESEAAAIASLSRYLIAESDIPPDEILILIRSDRNGAFSKPLAKLMADAAVPFYVNVSNESILDQKLGRLILSVLRLAITLEDSLAWRALLQLRPNKLGPVLFGRIYDRARQGNSSFAQALAAYCEEADAPPRIKAEYQSILALRTVAIQELGDVKEVIAADVLLKRIESVATLVAADPADLVEIMTYLQVLVEETQPSSIEEALGAITMRGLAPEQERQRGAVNLLTMHKAKGLSASAVIAMACEDEYLPGRQQSAEQEADERRLLYVSLTRAKQRLFITYAQRRTGPQRHTGRDSGSTVRRLTRYLRNAPLPAQDGEAFVMSLGSAESG